VFSILNRTRDPRGSSRRPVPHLPRLRQSPNRRILGRLNGCHSGRGSVIDEVKRIPGFFIATGFSGMASGLARAGRLMADLVAGDTPVVDPRPFRLDRFARAH